MANPRQRRKSRSGTSKVKQSKASVKNKHKVIVKGPEVLVANWDRKKTVRQNYAILGLLPTLNPRQAGGIEPVEGVPFAIASKTALDGNLSDLEFDDDDKEDEEEEGEEGPEASTSNLSVKVDEGRKLAKGEGRIIRDKDGKILKIVIGGEDGEEVEEAVVPREEREGGEEEEDEDEEEEDSDQEVAELPPQTKTKSSLKSKKVKKPVPVVGETKLPTPWGTPMEVWDGEGSDAEELEDEVELGPRSVGQGIPIGVKRRKVVAKTEVVRQLETLAATQKKVIRHTSALESDWLMDLINKHGDDVEKMTRDRKLNVWQKTVGEIKRAVAKAGGFSKLKAKILRMQAEAEAATDVETGGQ